MNSTISSNRIDEHTLQVSIHRGPAAVSCEYFLSHLSESQTFRSEWIRFLQSVDFSSLRWECPPIRQATLDTPFECVVINSPGLDKTADPSSFNGYFLGHTFPACTFASLRGDTQLIAPCPIDQSANYAHLKSTMNTAPLDQCHALWQLAGSEAMHLAAKQTIWFNTAGAGVPWLHIRVDSRPKYYQHERYRQLYRT